MIVQLETWDLFVAVCPGVTVDQHGAHDHVWIENPRLKSVECRYCRKILKVRAELAREIDAGTYVNCECGGSLVCSDPRSLMVQEALRIFGGSLRRATPIVPREVRAGVILRCSNCNVLNRIWNSRRSGNGFYTCGKCKVRLN